MENYKCYWCLGLDIAEKYHDEEWGVPVFDDRKQFEYLFLEVMQCGLNWNMMLKKREIFRKYFDDFDYKKIACYDEEKINKILSCDGMIKSPRKINAIINNARLFINIIDEYGSFCNYLWGFTDGYTLVYKNHSKENQVASNELSDKISKDMKKRGFKFLGSITIYSHLQACGIINDHEKSCYRYEQINKMNKIRFID